MDWYQALKTRLPPPGPVKISDEHSVVSSVIIPIGWNKETGRDEILMTKRTQKVQTHKGQVGFPGGVYSVEDAEVLKTALRECEEEIGVPPKSLEIIGMLKPVTTLKDMLIFPYVAKMEFPFPFVLSIDEVARIIYLPLDDLLHEIKNVEVEVGDYKVKSIGTTVDGELIWGASARMLQEIETFF